jgi:3-oxoacyl-(acyl-carrier-protein) synthase
MGSADDIANTIGKEVPAALADALKGIDVSEDWQKTALGITADFVDAHGANGVDLAWKAIDKAMKGESPDLSGMSLLAASELLAKMQSDEFKDASAVRDWFVVVGQTVGPLIAAGLRTALASI